MNMGTDDKVPFMPKKLRYVHLTNCFKIVLCSLYGPAHGVRHAYC